MKKYLTVQEAGAKGGSSKSTRKIKASRKNGKRGGRPKKAGSSKGTKPKK